MCCSTDWGLPSSAPDAPLLKLTPKLKPHSYRNYAEKKEEYPDATFLAEDEAVLLSVPTITRMWALKGTQPIIPTRFGTKERRTLFGAVNLRNGILTGHIADTGNKETFRTFLSVIRKSYPRGPIIMILDNVRFHHAKTIQKHLKQYPRLSFLFLPPYYPKLNPQEMVWQILRRNVTHNTYYPTFAKEVAAAKRFFKNAVIDIKNSSTSLIIRK